MIHPEQRQEITRQIGMGNILSISGGRVVPVENGVELPVSSGYHVRVVLDEGWDDYTISRIQRRGGKEYVHGEIDHVYCDQVGHFAYRAGMFRSFDKEEWVK
jgi:hypothetical protein